MDALSTSKAVVLLSGGLDSATVLAIAQRDGHRVFALSFDYGQRHRVELARAREVAAAMNVEEHRLVSIDLRALGGSALTSDALAVPKHPRTKTDPGTEGAESMEDGADEGIPVTYVPARNSVFLSVALGYAEVIGAETLYYGANALDYSGYPDCRPAFVEAFERLANVATKAGLEGKPFRVEAPLMHLTKADIIRKGLELGVDYGRTHSCYDPVGAQACGACDACRIRLAGFAAVGVRDPVRYVEGDGACPEGR
ncbi:MAG: 7-cyano-7-deazaguanine synthase QueC [Deltaproteobacteria bacterium]|nr:7-cyano-7-deazaguanine synthase QueC [Deltaproteobacteria bacterium]